jgi:hypothetical protein
VPAIDPAWLFLSLIPGGIGFVLFTYGRKQQRYVHAAAGVAFMVYPYFTPTILSMTAVGAALGTGLWLAVRAGW